MRSSLLEDLTRLISKVPAVELAVLFGSAARGALRPGSDVDLALRAEPMDRPVRVRLEAEIERALGRTLDVVAIDTVPPQLAFEIARDGVLVVERRPFAWADFRARAMIEWWDFAPLARRMHAGAIDRMRERNPDAAR